MKRLLLFLTSCLLLLDNSILHGETSTAGEKPIVVVTASYNNRRFYKLNLDSVFVQQYSNWHLIYVDDCSPDDTGNLVEAYVAEKGFQQKVTLIKNSERKLALANLYTAIMSCDNKAIIVILDGDDFIINKDVFSYINKVYSSDDIWLTYGQFQFLSNRQTGWCEAMPKNIIEDNLFREYHHTPSHLRTFYAGLFKKIKVEDLQTDGIFYSMTYDMAIMLPMIEMARNGHFKFISELLLIYNDLNPINDHRVSKELQRKIDLHIRSLPKYEALTTLFN